MDGLKLIDGKLVSVTSVIRETWLSKRPSAFGALVAALSVFVVAVGSVLAWNHVGGEWMPASGQAVFLDHQYWRAWSTLFVHADPGHFLSNSLLMFILGTLLAGYFGVLMFPAAAFFLGGVVNLLILKTYDPEMQLIGASGVVFLMGGAWLTMYALLNRRKSVWQRALRAIGVALLLFMPSETFDPSISYRTHALGFAFGVVLAVAFFLLKKNEFRAAEVTELVVDEIGEESHPTVLEAPLDFATNTARPVVRGECQMSSCS